MESKYMLTWEEYKAKCEKEGRPINEKEEPYMKAIMNEYAFSMENFIISLLL